MTHTDKHFKLNDMEELKNEELKNFSEKNLNKVVEKCNEPYTKGPIDSSTV